MKWYGFETLAKNESNIYLNFDIIEGDIGVYYGAVLGQCLDTEFPDGIFKVLFSIIFILFKHGYFMMPVKMTNQGSP